MKRFALFALACACSGGNSRAGEFYGIWDLLKASETSSCVGTDQLSGTISFQPGTGSFDLTAVMRDWPPCTGGANLDVSGDTATGTAMCSFAGSDGSTVDVDLQSLSFSLDSTGQFITLGGMQTQTDSDGSACALTLAGSAYKPGVTSN